MDLQKIADSFAAMTCIISVERKQSGHGTIRIVTGNRAYLDSIEKPADGLALLTQKFVPNSEYSVYFTQDLNFEDACYNAAVKKKCVHSYVHPERLDAWFNLTFLPLAIEDGDICYCTYTMEIDTSFDSHNMTSISGELSASVLSTCIKLRGSNDFRSAIKDVIKDVRELCGAEHCCILLLDQQNRTCTMLAEAFPPDTKLLPMETYLDENFYNIAESWADTIGGSNCLIAKDEHDMQIIKQRNPVWYESLTGAMAKRIVMFPLKFNNELLGYMWAINFDKDSAEKIKEALELTTFIVSSEISNFLLLNRLQKMSSEDTLTGVMNRNEMNGLVEKISSGTRGHGPLGVLFADLNGLKRINDDEGHNAGDRILKAAAEVLKELFDVHEIFRAGGDEFCVISYDIKEEELEKKKDDIKRIASSNPDLSFAVGTCFVSDRRAIRPALHLADERMYEDKKKFYLEHPDKRHSEKWTALKAEKGEL